MQKIHTTYGSIIVVLVCVIGVLCWQLLSYATMYSQNVDYCSELAFSFGYAFAKDQDIQSKYREFHHRLNNIKYDGNTLSVEIWPKKNEWLNFVRPTVQENLDTGTVDCYISKLYGAKESMSNQAGDDNSE